MTDAEIVALERVLKLAETQALDSTWPGAMAQALACHAIETVRTFLETRGYGVPTFEPGSVAYLPDAKALESYRAELDAEAHAYHLDAEDIEAIQVELLDKYQRRVVA